MTQTKNITIQENDLAEFTKKLNEFNEKEKVFATQTHVTAINGGLTYTAVLFCRVLEE
jgi:hypothetical protein